MAVRLVVSKGPLSGMVLSLEEGDNWSIGKDAKQSDIAIEDSGLAPCQVIIYKEEGVYYIKNTDSSKEVLVGGNPISDPVPLKDGDQIVLGSNTYSFFIEKEDDFNEAFFFEFGETDDALPPVKSEQGGAKHAEQSLVGSGQAKEVSGKNSSASQEFTEKDQALSEAFLASAKNSGASDSAEKVEIPDNQESSENKGAESVSAVGASSPQDQEIPLSSPENSSSSNGGGESPKEEEQSKEEKLDKDASKSEHPEATSPEGKKSEDSSGDDAAAEEKTKEEDSHPEAKEEESGEETPEGEQAAKKEEQPKETQNEGGDSKPKVLAPFEVQDLFDFDKGIFPAELDNSSKDVTVDLSRPSRFLLKVLAGANIGAEFHLDAGKEYIIGSNPDICDIVFDDTSVSHQHAKLIVGNEGTINIEDLGSKNGVIVEGKKIENSSSVSANMVVALGTTLFLIIDQQAPAETIVASFAPENYSLFGRQDPEEDPLEEEQKEMEEVKKATLPTGTFILTLFIGGLAILFGIGTASLFHSKEVIPIENIDFQADLDGVTKLFPGVRYTFNKNNGQLFLVGHVKNGIEKSELMYKIDSLSFVKSIDDNVIDDEAVWQEMNILLSKRPEFKGITMSSPEPGRFVLTGYVKTEEQAACLTDYLNLHFQYLSLLDNTVIVENIMLKSIEGRLLQNGFGNIQVSFVNGELILTGYVNNSENERFRAVIQELGELPGIRVVKNFSVLLPAEEGLIDLSHRYPNRYRVTGYSKYGDVSINVVVNGKILTRGDVIDGMTVTSIQPNSIFLERDGLKYKIDYNK